MDIRTKPQIIHIDNFRVIAKDYDTFFWHFISENHNAGTDVLLKSLYLEETDFMENNHPMKEIQEMLNIHIFESYIKDSVDFLNNLGVPFDRIYNRKTKRFQPFFIGFRGSKFMGGTNITTTCHCVNGVTDVIYQTNPTIFESLSELGIEEENLK
jgi:hypothetical protein